MLDQKNEKVNFASDDFELVQNNEKIYDQKFSTKPTTFVKDALKRFRKNKSSVIAAFIIGILMLLSFLVPVVSPYDLEVKPTETLLLPKLFNSGTGFWDGTVDYDNQIYDEVEQQVYNFDSRGVVEGTQVLGEKYYVDIPQGGSNFGTLVLVNLSTTKAGQFYNNQTFTFDNGDQVSVSIDFSDDARLQEKYTHNASYKVYFSYKNQSNIERKVELTSSTSATDASFPLTLQGSDTIAKDVKVSIELAADTNATYLAIDEIKFNAVTTDNNLKEDLNAVNLTNVSKVLQSQGSVNTTGIWNDTGLEGSVFQAEVVPASFTYDPYEVVYGDYDTTVTTAQVEQWIANGWISLDLNNAASFNKLSEKSPINDIISIERKTGGPSGFYYEIEANVSGYKLLGYDSAPKFWFGTQADGTDLFLAVFSGLNTSLLLAIAVSAIAFFIGIIWGSISGYYGGNIDIVMERFVEILRGIPWIVLITVTVLVLGNNLLTFLVAICLVNWTSVSSRTRTQFYRFKRREYVLASRTLGAKDRRLIFKHILPNGLGTIITGSILMIPGVIFTEAILSYLGLGVQGQRTLGTILSTNQTRLENYPFLLIVPAVIISLIMISFNLFGNGLRDALNPTLKGSE